MADKMQALQCKKCGAPLEKQNEEDVYACPYCTVNYILEHSDNKPKKKMKYIPHKITREEIDPFFKKWTAEGNYTPDDVVVKAKITQAIRLMIPVYKIWGNYRVNWHGEIGFDRYKTKTYYDDDGNRRTKKEKYIDWQYKNGQYTKSFDELKVASEIKFDYEFLVENTNFKLRQIQTGSPEDFDGDIQIMNHDLPVELVKEDLKSGFNVDFKIYDVHLKLPGDHQREIDATYDFMNTDHKMAFLPFWLVQYQYKNKKYLFMLDGQNGRISGARPLDSTRIKKSELILNNGKYAKYVSGGGVLLYFYLNGAHGWVEFFIVAFLAFIPVYILKLINKIQNRRVLKQSKTYRQKLLACQNKKTDPSKIEPPKMKTVRYYQISYAVKLLAVLATIYIFASIVRIYEPEINSQVEKIKEKLKDKDKEPD